METAEKTEFEVRKQEFLVKYKNLIDECKVDLFSYPTYTPDGAGGFKTVIVTNIVDTSNTPVKSPFQHENS